MAERELRFLDATEVRAVGGTSDADPLRLEGYASVFNRFASLPGFRERILPGAFTRAIDQKMDVVCLWNHNSDTVLGRTTSGTLNLIQDSRGLRYTVDLPNTQAGRDAHESVRRGDVNGCSFGFIIDTPDGQKWTEAQDADGTYFAQRDISDLKLLDVSPVTYPCYDGTQVVARSAEVPVELRSAVDAKNAARVATIVPPAVEKRPYSSVSEVPDSVPKASRKQWMEIWNSVYKKEIADGKSQKDAESSAFAQANGVIKKQRESKMKIVKGEFRAVVGIDDNDINPVDCPASWSDEMKQAYCNGYNAAYKKAREAGLKWDVAVSKAISGGMMGIHEMLARPDQSGSEQPPVTYADTDKDGSGGPADDVNRSKDNPGEQRHDEEDDDDGDGQEEDGEERDLLEDGFDNWLLGRSLDKDKLHAEHREDGDCDIPGCACQNRFCPNTNPQRGEEAPAGVEYKDVAGTESFVRFDEVLAELRAGMARTKRVGGKDLTAKSFAYVGDPDKTETWKFPIHDASHVRNALARWGQDKGIPAAKQAGVYAKIKAAAKRFGIEVSEKDSDKARAANEEIEFRLRAAEHMAKMGPECDFRYGWAQPRNDGGKFGTTDEEKASSADEHRAASVAHHGMALDHMKKGQKEAADAHASARNAHAAAMVAKASNDPNMMQRTEMAQAHSKVANEATRRCNM